MELCCSYGAAAYGLLSITTLSVLGPVLDEELKVIASKSKKVIANDAESGYEPDTMNTSMDMGDDEDELDDDVDENAGPSSSSSKSNSNRKTDNSLSVASLKFLLHDFSRRSHLFKSCRDDHPLSTDMAILRFLNVMETVKEVGIPSISLRSHGCILALRNNLRSTSHPWIQEAPLLSALAVDTIWPRTLEAIQATLRIGFIPEMGVGQGDVISPLAWTVVFGILFLC